MPNATSGVGRWALLRKSGAQRHPKRTRRTWRDVGVAVRGRVVVLVEQVLDVQLRPHLGRHVEEAAAINSRVARQDHEIVGGGEHVAAMDEPEANAPSRRQVVLVPERKRVAAAVARARRPPSAVAEMRLRDLAVLQRVATDQAPLTGDVAAQCRVRGLSCAARRPGSTASDQLDRARRRSRDRADRRPP